MSVRIGVISDTHGLLREEAISALAGVDRIIHAGDIGREEVIERLQEMAPVTAIKGNVDRDEWAAAYPDTAELRVEGCSIYVLHNLKELNLPEGTHYDVVIAGHSHIAKEYSERGVFYFNPGSAGPRRFKLPVTLGILVLDEGNIHSEIIALKV